MSENYMSPEDITRMFARMDEAMPDTSAVRRKFLNCPYGEDPRQAVDIYLPDEGAGPFPAVLFMHGGGWAMGSRSDAQMAPFIKGVTRGYAFVSVGYRLLPRVRWPDPLLDVKAAMRWLRANADTYLIDAERVALTGASAGGQLALMAAYTQGVAAFEDGGDGRTCRVLAVVDQFAPTDFLTLDAQFDESGYMRTPPDDPRPGEELLGVRWLADAPNLSRFVSPVDSVHANAPPTLILHGRYDPVVPYQQSVELCERIRAVCGEDRAALYIDEYAMHADPTYANQEWTDIIFGFLDAYLN